MTRPIIKEECTEIGFIQKPHGIHGEVSLKFDPGLDLTIEESEYLFIEIEGGLVPFYIEDEGLRFRSAEAALVKFRFVDSQEKAKEISGNPFFVFTDEITVDEEDFAPSLLIDFNVFDKTKGAIGKITQVDDFSGNMVLTIEHNNTEFMVPLSDEILTEIDEENKQIKLNCPEGLLDLYLE